MDKKFLTRFVKGVISIGIGTSIQVMLGFLSLILVVRYVAKEDLGVFFIIQVVATFIGAISSLAMINIAVTKLIAGAEGKERTDYVKSAIGYKILFSFGIGVIILFSKPLIIWIFKSET